jgi:hypothetical protein
VSGRIRRDWFDRFLENPIRFCPGTPMPAMFERGKPAPLTSIFDGDADKQKEALWSYLARGKDAPEPKPPDPLPVVAPASGAPALVAQIPIRLQDGSLVEAICVLNTSDDLLIYDLSSSAPQSVFTGAQILRTVQGRIRSFRASGTATPLTTDAALGLAVRGKTQQPTARELHGYDALGDGVRIRWRASFDGGTVEVVETLRFDRTSAPGALTRELSMKGIPGEASILVRTRETKPGGVHVAASTGTAQSQSVDEQLIVTVTPVRAGTAVVTMRSDLPPVRAAPRWEGHLVVDPGRAEGSLERPGYRAIAHPRPKTVSGEDRVMPVALTTRPRDGQVFVSSWKTGEILALRDPNDNGVGARFDNFGRGPFQDAFSMLAEDDALYVLHRRNLTRLVDTNDDGVADRIDRVAALPHGIADTYDYAYGLVRDKSGDFIMSFAPYANTHLPGSGGAIRLHPGEPPREVAFGFRNPLGWCAGPDGEVFFTDNQGEWVATNKLCHLAEGRFFGFPNNAQKQHTTRPAGRTAVWVPYGWARSINGVAYDNTRGQFGPFAGQFFLAELMFGGGIVRATVEKVNGQFQGACFPFWGKGLLGPVCLAFDRRGRLFVGGITEPGWMAQPDRGALYRIDFTGETPFEMTTIQIRPRGFRILFTAPVDRDSAAHVASFHLDHYRYELTGSYGSPELDRTAAPIERAVVAEDGRSVELTVPALVKGRVYLLNASGIRSVRGEKLVHPAGAYTVNEIPSEDTTRN